MKTFLRNKVTGAYFEGIDSWTPRVEQAFDFQCPERAVRFVLAASLNADHMELIFGFRDPRYNLSLPIDERFGVKPLRGVSEQPASRRRACHPQAARGAHRALPVSSLGGISHPAGLAEQREEAGVVG
jgi:hypothetical protein